jgi:transposase
MWCIPELSEEFTSRMENILNLYARPYKADEPVVCFDEKPVQLLKDSRDALSGLPGHIKKVDYEYIRCGTANILAAVEPKVGKHVSKVTRFKKGKDFAQMCYRIARQYNKAKVIHLVVDNYKTHSLKSLVNYYGQEKGEKIWKRFKIHYTPKHASWLNQAEIELSLISRQCLGKNRLGDIQVLTNKIKEWNMIANRDKIKICWKFTTKAARKKFKY